MKNRRLKPAGPGRADLPTDVDHIHIDYQGIPWYIVSYGGARLAPYTEGMIEELVEEGIYIEIDERGIPIPKSEPQEPKDKIDALLAERRSVYGPNPFNQETVAQAWQSTLESHFQTKLPGPIPSHIVALMMVQIKVLRAACPFKYQQDNYNDMHGYTKIAEVCAKPTVQTLRCKKCDEICDESQMCNFICPRCSNNSLMKEGTPRNGK